MTEVIQQAHTHMLIQGFEGGATGKESTCQCRRLRRCQFDPWVRKIPWRREPTGNPFQYSSKENLMDRESCQATVHRVVYVDLKVIAWKQSCFISLKELTVSLFINVNSFNKMTVFNIHAVYFPYFTFQLWKFLTIQLFR